MDDQTRYTAKLFLTSVLPLLKVVAAETSLADSWAGKNGTIQVSVLTDEGKLATHFKIKDGDFTTGLRPLETPDLELYFKSVEHFNAFFKGQTKKLPKIIGLTKPLLLINTMRTLLKMSSLLSVEQAPADPKEQALLTKMMFYLLTSGISRLNKLGHPDIKKWTTQSPDRVYALTVDNHEDIAAFLRIKAGNSKAARGRYTRSKPFFTMRFADVESALAILLDTGDLLALTAEGKLKMEGAPEFGAKLGDFMMLVGEYVQ